MLRFDNHHGKRHFNKSLQRKIAEPHVHDPKFPGGIREALHFETPKKII